MSPVSVSSTATPTLENTSDGTGRKDSLFFFLKFLGEKELKFTVYQLYQNKLQYLEFSEIKL